MNRSIFVCALMIATAASLAAQQSDQYEGTSKPPSNETIVSDTPADVAPAPLAKPSPAHVYAAPVIAQPIPVQAPAYQNAPVDTANNVPADGSDNGIVQIAPDPQSRPSLSQRAAADPDGDIVHPAPLGANELGEGTLIRVRLLNEVSTAFSEDGEKFRSRVASDVVQDDRVLIPADSEIDGRITNVSKGGFGGHGSMNLIPESVILPNGSRYRLYGQVTSTPGTDMKVNSEGTVGPGSRLKRNSIEYGGAVGTGAVTGAILGGPAGALAGSLIGAGVITAHLLISHPQATLDEGTYLQFTLTERLNLVPAAVSGN